LSQRISRLSFLGSNLTTHSTTNKAEQKHAPQSATVLYFDRHVTSVDSVIFSFVPRMGFRRTRTQRSGTQSAAAGGTRTRWLFELRRCRSLIEAVRGYLRTNGPDCYTGSLRVRARARALIVRPRPPGGLEPPEPKVRQLAGGSPPTPLYDPCHLVRKGKQIPSVREALLPFSSRT
jgi:hypothetical protein